MIATYTAGRCLGAEHTAKRVGTARRVVTIERKSLMLLHLSEGPFVVDKTVSSVEKRTGGGCPLWLVFVRIFIITSPAHSMLLFSQRKKRNTPKKNTVIPRYKKKLFSPKIPRRPPGSHGASPFIGNLIPSFYFP